MCACVNGEGQGERRSGGYGVGATVCIGFGESK